MGTRLRHIARSSIEEIELILESLPEEVSIKEVMFAKGKWYVFFCIAPYQFVAPLNKEDLIQQKNKEK